MRRYRNVVVAEDGSLTGQRTLGRGDTWIRFSASPRLLRISEAINLYPDAQEVIWELQDGYGSPGYTPVQGYDWSGIRDSSDEAIEAMYQVARTFVSDAEMDNILGLG